MTQFLKEEDERQAWRKQPEEKSYVDVVIKHWNMLQLWTGVGKLYSVLTVHLSFYTEPVT